MLCKNKYIVPNSFMQKVTGIGGVFIKAKDPKNLTAWYQKHLGINFGDELYTNFKWNNSEAGVPGNTVFSFFKNDSTYFDPSLSGFMINFRVDNLIELIAALKEEGIETAGDLVEEEYGKFSWIVDPEGNKIELWQPYDDKL